MDVGADLTKFSIDIRVFEELSDEVRRKINALGRIPRWPTAVMAMLDAARTRPSRR
jgi:hypothetical protein